MVLVTSLIFLAILGILGTTAYLGTTTDLKISANYKTSLQAFYASGAGLEEARARMRLLPSNPNHIKDPVSGYNPMWSAYILTSASWQTSDDPFYDSNLTNYIPHSSSQTSNAIMVNSLQSNISYFAKIRYKTEYDAEQLGHTPTSAHYYDGDGDTSTHTAASPGNMIYYGFANPSSPTTGTQFTTSGSTHYKPVQIVTGYGTIYGSMQIVETEVIFYPGPPIQAALYAKGNVTGNGNAMTVTGDDNCGVGAPLPPVYTLSPAATTLVGNPTMAGTPPSPVTGPVGVNITEYVTNLKSTATVFIPSDQNGTTYGSSSNYTVCYSNTSSPYNVGGLKLQNVTGYGLLLIEGDLVLAANVNWSGVILVTGVLTLNGGASGINIRGAVLANQTVTINGSLDIRYDTCNINSALYDQTRKVVSWRQIY